MLEINLPLQNFINTGNRLHLHRKTLTKLDNLPQLAIRDRRHGDDNLADFPLLDYLTEILPRPQNRKTLDHLPPLGKIIIDKTHKPYTLLHLMLFKFSGHQHPGIPGTKNQHRRISFGCTHPAEVLSQNPQKKTGPPQQKQQQAEKNHINTAREQQARIRTVEITTYSPSPNN